MEQIIGKAKHDEFLNREFNSMNIEIYNINDSNLIDQQNINNSANVTLLSILGKDIHDVGTGKSCTAISVAEKFKSFIDAEIDELLLIDNWGDFYERLMPNYDILINHQKLKDKLMQMRSKIKLSDEL